jgi:4-amino-4-deoxy-L-arabinose transferase-like glycosyltransferase
VNTAGLKTRLTSGWALLFLACTWLAAGAWVRPLALPDEGRYVGVAWEMLRSGNWLVPTLDGLPYFHKPPLFYWITASSLATFGMHDWAARVASLVGAAISAFALFTFARRWSGASTARLALVALVLQPLIFVAAQYANLDMLLAGFVAATTLALAHVALEDLEGRSARGVLAIAYVFAALGLLAKGLIGIVLPGMVIIAWLLALRRPRTILRLLWLPGMLVFLVIAAPWFIAMQSRFPDFAHYFFVVQHFQRFSGSGFNNAQPFWFYPVVIALATLPWFGWLAGTARRGWWTEPQHGQLRMLMAIWIAVITVFFSMPQSKLVGYILPVTVPLAFLVAESAGSLVKNRGWMRRLWQLSAVAAIAICVGVLVFASLRPTKSLKPLAQELARQIGPHDAVVFLHDYYFDLPFYAQLRSPVRVIEEWDSEPERDNWAKELRDANRFAAVGAQPVLLTPERLVDVVCTAPATWVVGYWSLAHVMPAMAEAVEITQAGETLLWRVEGKTAAKVNEACLETPSASSADK